MVDVCISNDIQIPGSGIQGPLHSDLKLSKQYFMLLYFPLFILRSAAPYHYLNLLGASLC